MSAEVGGSYWIIASLTNALIAIPNDIGAYLEKSGYYPVTLKAIEGIKKDRGLFTLDWDSRIEIKCALNEVMPRSWPQDENISPNQLEELDEVNTASIIHALGLRFGKGAYLTKVGGGSNSVYLWANPIMSEIGRSGSNQFRGGGNGGSESSEVLSSMSKVFEGTTNDKESNSVYSIMESVRQTINTEKCHQTVIFRGCKGSGKTEALKSAIQYLLFAEGIAKNNEAKSNISELIRYCKKENSSQQRDGVVFEKYVALGHSSHRFIVDIDVKSNGAVQPASSKETLLSQKVLAGLLIFDYFFSCGSDSSESSSQCIKRVKILYDTKDGVLSESSLRGAEMSASMVDTNRLGSGSTNTCFNIFAMMMIGLSSEELSRYGITSPMRNAYIASSSGMRAENELKSSFVNFKDTLQRAGCDDTLFAEVIQGLACVCHLQSITVTGSDSAQLSTSSVIHVNAVEKLLGTQKGSITDFILKNDAGRLGVIDHKPADARIMLQSLCLGIYYRTVHFLSAITCYSSFVQEYVSTNAGQSKAPLGTGIKYVQFVDAIGYENVDLGNTGNLYTLCRNYSNERFGYQYAEVAFDKVILEYTNDGVNLPNYTSPTDGVVSSYTELFDKLGIGVTNIVEDVCKSMRPEDKSMLEKFISAHSKSKMVRLAGHKATKRTEFMIQHSFHICAYDVDGFSASNVFPSLYNRKKSLITALLNSNSNVNSLTETGFIALTAKDDRECGGISPAASSGNLAAIVDEKAKPGRGNASSKVDPKEFLLTNTKDSLSKLLGSFAGTAKSNTSPKASTLDGRVRYVLCLQSNQNMSSYKFDGSHMIHQIKHNLVSDLANLHKNTLFSYSYRHMDFYRRYRAAFLFECADLPPVPQGRDVVANLDKITKLLLDLCISDALHLGFVESQVDADSKFGKSYFTDTDNTACKFSAMFGFTTIYLRSELSHILERVLQAKKIVYTTSAVRIQAHFRMNSCRKKFGNQKVSSTLIASIARKNIAKMYFNRLKRSANRMRANVKMKKARWHFIEMKNAVNYIKKVFLGAAFFRTRTKYLSLRRDIEVFHMMAKGCLAREKTRLVLRKMKLLQSNALYFIFRCRWYYKKLAASNNINRMSRGFITRQRFQIEIAEMRINNIQRIATKTATFLQWRFRSRRISRRYNALRSSTLVIQSWLRSRLFRVFYVKLMRVTIWAQSNARRIVAINRVSYIYADHMLAQEQAKLSVIRKEELSKAFSEMNNLFGINSSDRIEVGSGFLQDKISHYKTYCVGFDIGASSVTTSFPAGLLKSLAIFHYHFSQKGKVMATPGALSKEAYEARSMKSPNVNGISTRSPSKSPKKDVSFTNPKISKNVFRLSKIVGGSQHILIIDELNNIYGLGAGDGGQLGDCDFKSREKPILLESLMAILRRDHLNDLNNHSSLKSTSTASGSRAPMRSINGGFVTTHTRSTTGVGAVSSVNNNALTTITCGINANVTICDICCGYEHTMILSDSGLLWSWGSNTRGQLGHSNFSKSNAPVLVKFNNRGNKYDTAQGAQVSASSVHSKNNSVKDESDNNAAVWRGNNNIREISCGSHHSACVNADGFLYTWGASECLGSSPSPATENASLKKKLRGKGSDDSSFPEIVRFFANNAIYGGQKLKVSNVCCGDQHVHCFATPTLKHSSLSNGKAYLYAWGNNGNGQLGIGDLKCQLQHLPIRVYALPDIDINDLVEHKLSNRSSTYKNGKTHAIQVKNMPPALQLRSNGRHVLLLIQGKLWAWGSNKAGQVGNKHSADVYSPLPIVMPACIENGIPTGQHKSRVVTVSAGWRHSCATCEDGSVFTWGAQCIIQNAGIPHGTEDTGSEGEKSEVIERPSSISFPTLVSVFDPNAIDKESIISTQCISNSNFTMMTINAVTLPENDLSGSRVYDGSYSSPKKRTFSPTKGKLTPTQGSVHLGARCAEAIVSGDRTSSESEVLKFGGSTPKSPLKTKENDVRFHKSYDINKLTYRTNDKKWETRDKTPLSTSYSSEVRNLVSMPHMSFHANHGDIHDAFKKQLGGRIKYGRQVEVPRAGIGAGLFDSMKAGDTEEKMSINDLSLSSRVNVEANASARVQDLTSQLDSKIFEGGFIEHQGTNSIGNDTNSSALLKESLTVDGIMDYFIPNRSTIASVDEPDDESSLASDSDELPTNNRNLGRDADKQTSAASAPAPAPAAPSTIAFESALNSSGKGLRAPTQAGRRSSITGEFNTFEGKMKSKLVEHGVNSKEYINALRSELDEGCSYSSYFDEDKTSADIYKVYSPPDKKSKKGPNLSSVRDLHKQIENIRLD